MARLPDEVINRIKRDVSLLRLVESQGYKLTKQGKDYAICCPFHDDKDPSCIISPKSNLFHCFGCNAAGSVIDWVMKTQGVSFRHAVELLHRGDPLSLAADQGVKRTTVPKLAAPISEDADDPTLLREVIDYYHATLKQAPEALAYLQQRGLDDPALIDRFKLGYANRTLGLRLPQKNRKAGATIRTQLERTGLYRNTGREHFNGSLVIPVIDANGLITEVYGRKLRDDLRPGTPKHTYLPGPHRGVFNVEGLQGTAEAILCESLIDALTFWRWGFRHVTASFGVNGFTDDMLQAFIAHKIQRVLIAYDRDEAGSKAAEAVAAQLSQHGIDCFRILFPKGMDANEYACQVSPPQKSLALVIRKAQWLGSGRAPAITTEAAGAELPSLLAAKKESPADAIAESAPSLETPATAALDTQATPMPNLNTASVEVSGDDKELFITLGDRVYRVRGLDKNSDADQLKIQLLAKRGDAFHMDKLDLYSSKQRQVFINQACVELGVNDEVIKKDLGKLLLTLEEQQTKQREVTAEKQPTALEPEARRAAFELLHDPELLNRILADFACAGVVGEETNKLVGYLACVSRKLERPLAVLIQSSSAAGKSSLMDAILALMPDEERVQYSAMTGQSLFYMGETDLKNKILAISEEEGAHNASYALKLLQSEGEVTIASTGKDDSTGNLVTKEYTVQGPVMLFMTTTAIDIDEELLNRCVVLSVNESREQTQAIHAAQRARRTLQGLQAQLEKERLVELHRNAQRLLKPLRVINPYADQLTFLDDKTRTRRDHEKYLTLIDSIALVHQYQREVKTLQHNGQVIEYVEVTLDDIATANRLAHEILGRTLDELPPQTRKLLKEIHSCVHRQCQAQDIEQRDCRFSRKTVRDWTGWGNTQLKVHLKRLEDMEYLLVHRGGRGQAFDYELLYDAPSDSDNHLMGLIDVDRLQNCHYDTKQSGVKPEKSGPSRPQVGGKSAQTKWLKPAATVACSASGSIVAKSALEAV
jgi:DNA primase